MDDFKETVQEDDWIEDESIYSEDTRESMVEDDEISPEEEAFMRGYDEAA